MKTRACIIGASLICATLNADAQNFTSGSDGSYGPINITTDTTLDLPESGIFNATTINVAASRTLRFKKNSANTPVHLLATGDVVIAGRIEVNATTGNSVIGGFGGPGGFDGGSPGSISVPPGSGYGPGAGRGGTGSTSDPNGTGSGSFSTVSTTGASTGKGTTYGNALLIPMIGGSGGGGSIGAPGSGGGGGGGAILIASTTRIDLPTGGRVEAVGGNNSGGGFNSGSGGAIRLIAPAITGNGTLQADTFSGGGMGRIRVDAIDRSNMNLNFTTAAITSVGSLMTVFPSPLPRLDITEAAGQVIAENSGPVIIQLPFGSSADRQIKVRAKDFNAIVPITLVLTPDHGSPIRYTTTINNTGANNPATITMDVTLPVNEQTTVNVYSK